MPITFKILVCSASFFLSVISSAHAAQFQCSIKNVLRMNENGEFVTHEWTPNYLNREFTVERESGKVVSTTALKVRLSNFNKDYLPQLLMSETEGDSYKAVTLYENTGQAALLQINHSEAGNPRPFFYLTNIGMTLTGTCDEKS